MPYDNIAPEPYSGVFFLLSMSRPAAAQVFSKKKKLKGFAIEY
jgi:hypothetical protein